MLEPRLSPDPLMAGRPPVKVQRPDIRLTVTGYHDIRHDDAFKKGEWRDDSLCVKVCKDPTTSFKPEDWFPTTASGGQFSKAVVPPRVKEVCHACPVRIECLVYAIHLGVTEGVWAGHAVKTIRKMRNRIRK